MITLVNDEENDPTGETVTLRPAPAPALESHLDAIDAFVTPLVAPSVRYAIVLVDIDTQAIAIGGHGPDGQAARAFQVAAQTICHNQEGGADFELLALCKCSDCEARRFDKFQRGSDRRLEQALDRIALRVGIHPDAWANPDDITAAVYALIPAPAVPPAPPVLPELFSIDDHVPLANSVASFPNPDDDDGAA